MNHAGRILTLMLFALSFVGCSAHSGVRDPGAAEEILTATVTLSPEFDLQDSNLCDRPVRGADNPAEARVVVIEGTHDEADKECCDRIPDPLTLDQCRDFCDDQQKGEEACPRTGAAISDPQCNIVLHHDHRSHGTTFHMVMCNNKTQVCACDP